MSQITATRNRNVVSIAVFFLITLIMFATGCGPGKNPVWVHPEKTLEQAEEDMGNCYFDAFLAKRQNPVPEKFSKVEIDPREAIESAAVKCMKQAGYRQVASSKIEAPLRIKSGVAHTMSYSIAGK